METIGWIGGILLAICAAPEAYRSFKTKTCAIGWGLLSLWIIGEICLLIFEFGNTPTLQRSLNYIFNILLISVMIYYKVKGK